LQAIDRLSEQITDSGLQEQKIKPLVEQLQEAKNLETLYGTENAAEVSNLKTSVVVYEIKDKLVEVGRDQLAQDLENLHGGLNVAGFVPGVGEPFDVLNGIVYSLEGKPVDAGLSYLSAVPVWGYAANAGKGVKYGSDFMQGAGKFGDEIVEATFDSTQLQAKFKHAEAFGIEGSWNKVNADKFKQAIQDFIKSPETQTIKGSYGRGAQEIPVIHKFNPTTGQNVILDTKGNFISGWKLSPDQIRHLTTTGKIGGGK
jgi:hypothetical protein